MPAPVTVLTQDLYPVGTHYSTAVPWQAGLFNVLFTGLLSDPDLASAANSCVLAVEVSFDGGKTFNEANRQSWAGNTPGKTTGSFSPPAGGTGYTQSQTAPTHARARLELSASPLSIGISAAFN